MKGILKRVETKLSRRSAIHEADKRQSPVGDRVRPKENAEEEHSVESGLDAGVPERAENHEPGKDDPTPDIDACDDTITQQIKTLDESSLDDSESAGSSESAGVDPYNTG